MGTRKLRIVVGTQLRANVNFWNSASGRNVEGVDALMVSFGEIANRASVLQAASREGLRKYLGFKGDIFLDNGCYAMLRNGSEPSIEEYLRFIECAKPDWYPVPVDYVPSPSSSHYVARRLAEKTARMNEEFGPRGFVPVIHIGSQFVKFFHQMLQTVKPQRIAIGGMVPYLRYSRGADPKLAIDLLAHARGSFHGELHVFGFGGGITSLHLAAVLGIDSVDSSGWRVRAARGLILVPGQGERMVKQARGWKGPVVSREDRIELENCGCGTCYSGGFAALATRGRIGFEQRAIHNLWVLMREAALLSSHNSKLKTWSLARLRQNRMRYLVERAFEVTRRISHEIP